MQPSYGGSYIFGLACQVQHTPRPSAQQVNTFFGISGSVLVWGGNRGRAFFVTGVLVGADIPTVMQAEATLCSYDDGIARVFTDTFGRSWPYVIFSGQYQPDQRGPQFLCTPNNAGGWGLPYRAMFYSLF
jgi:hypothetical protein